MKEKIGALYAKYREIIIYLIVGVMTTVVSWAVVFLGKLVMDMDVPWQNFLNNSLSWLAGVCFAYPLNRRWVFKSRNPKIGKEFLGFAGSRVSTWVLDVIVMWFFVNLVTLEKPIAAVLGWFSSYPDEKALSDINYWVAKIFISSVLVTIANYIISKFFIFKGKEKKTEEKAEEN